LKKENILKNFHFIKGINCLNQLNLRRKLFWTDTLDNYFKTKGRKKNIAKKKEWELNISMIYYEL
tara:strand:+ start:590 stop:784 length:195 start_codon:yes stop_codon:yes gene_type:complete